MVMSEQVIKIILGLEVKEIFLVEKHLATPHTRDSWHIWELNTAKSQRTFRFIIC